MSAALLMAVGFAGGEMLFFYRELIDALAVVGLSGLEDYRWPLWLVWTIGVVLGLEAHRCALVVDYASLAGDCAVEEIACINLYSRLVGVYFHADSGSRAYEFGCELSNIAFGVEYPVVS